MSFSTWKAVGAAGALAVAVTTHAGVAAASTTPQASIPFADHGGIYDWRPNGDRGIWVQSAHHEWFYGTFVGACFGLDTAPRIGFVTDVTGEFDRWSSIVVPHEPRCHLSTFEASAPPARYRAFG
jgi:hypothetical protein